MKHVPIAVRLLVAVSAAAAVGACSSSGSSDPSASAAARPSPTATSASPGPAADPAQGYLDSVNALCDALLPKVLDATEGGSTAVPAKDWVRTWPAHKALLDGFDADLAAVPVPPEAAEPARVMTAYVAWATGIDRARIAAAEQGEAAWRAELSAEADIESAPELRALGPAGFSDSCQAR